MRAASVVKFSPDGFRIPDLLLPMMRWGTGGSTGLLRPLIETAGIKEWFAPRSTYSHINKRNCQWATFFYAAGKPLTTLGKSTVAVWGVSGNFCLFVL